MRGRHPGEFLAGNSCLAEIFSVENSFEQTNLELLDKTQAYLRARLETGGANTTLGLLWNRFYSLYDALIRKFASSRGLRGHDLDDCIQSVWMRVATRLSDFEHPRQRPGLRSWLYTLVRNESYDVMYRRKESRFENLEDFRRIQGDPIDPEVDPVEIVDRKWRKALLKTILTDMREEMTDRNWKLLEMRFGQGATVEQTASNLGLTADEVRYRQSRLLKKIRRRAAALTGEDNSIDV